MAAYALAYALAAFCVFRFLGSGPMRGDHPASLVFLSACWPLTAFFFLTIYLAGGW